MSHGMAVLPVRPAEDASDRQLLQRFVAERDEAAFAVLVRRHGPAVLRVCRRVIRDAHLAEDVCQLAFLVLARKAAAVEWRESVGGWVKAVAYRLARHAASARGRRRELLLNSLQRNSDDEQAADYGKATFAEQLTVMDPLAELTRNEVRRVVADELHRLPAKYRVPVVLCYLEGKTNEEAAHQLGWPAGSMSRRLARARALLREGLTRRGVTLLVLIACGAFAVLRSSERSPTPVAALMQPFKPLAQGGRDLENILRQLASGKRLEANDDAAQLAQQSAAIAWQLDQYVPVQEPQAWRDFAEAMRHAALDLSTALAVQDEPATFAAASRLADSCQKCHAVYRQ